MIYGLSLATSLSPSLLFCQILGNRLSPVVPPDFVSEASLQVAGPSCLHPPFSPLNSCPAVNQVLIRKALA